MRVFPEGFDFFGKCYKIYLFNTIEGGNMSISKSFSFGLGLMAAMPSFVWAGLDPIDLPENCSAVVKSSSSTPLPPRFSRPAPDYGFYLDLTSIPTLQPEATREDALSLFNTSLSQPIDLDPRLRLFSQGKKEAFSVKEEDFIFSFLEIPEGAVKKSIEVEGFKLVYSGDPEQPEVLPTRAILFSDLGGVGFEKVNQRWVPKSIPGSSFPVETLPNFLKMEDYVILEFPKVIHDEIERLLSFGIKQEKTT
jgi:hypothetical protein